MRVEKKCFNYYTIKEFLRYIFVGGTAFIIDFALMFFFNEFIFQNKFLYISIFLGYLFGLIYNFVLSCSFVFNNGFEKIKNKEIQCFLIFVVIGIIGLGLTEILMFILVNLISLHYMLSKIITGIIVMFWNYIARKVIIFK